VRTSVLALFSTALLALCSAALAAEPDFNSEIRPILSQNCFKCHGMDDKARKGSLRLDVRDVATKPAKSGETAIVPGQPDKSELIKRVFSTDDEEMMPPKSTKVELSAAQKEKLKDWIAAGAKYDAHWAFVAPKQPPVPQSKFGAGKNPIDAFVLSRLEKENLKPSPEADKYTLCRRVHLDLIGIPPTPEEADAFAKDEAPDAYEKLVAKLMAMPQYGERWARRWLDLARYADTNGYEKDRGRTMWPYRDWVVRALNADMPFDQFTVKQIAGDMLPTPSADDYIATGFHRNTMLNEEGGIDPLEYRYYAMVDRNNTTGTAWLGLTVGCCQCHTHKYDPILHKEYYSLMAFLDNADEPDYEIPDAARESKRAEIEAKIAKLTAELPLSWKIPTDAQFSPAVIKGGAVTTASGVPSEILADNAIKFGGVVPEKDTYTLTFDTDATNIDRLKLEVLKDGNTGPGRTPHGNLVLTEISVSVAPKDAPEKAQNLKLVRATADFSQKEFDVGGAIDGKPETGWAIDPGDSKTAIKDRSATFFFEKPVSLEKGARFTVKLEQNYGSKHVIGKMRLSLGAPVSDKVPAETVRKEMIDRRFAEWEKAESAAALKWQVLRPTEMKSTMPLLTQEKDGSILASGDITKSDTYELKFDSKLAGVTALRLEALPDENLPAHGPGMAFYEGPKGDFFLSEFHIIVGGQRLKPSRATDSYSKAAIGGGKIGAQFTQDGDMSSGWSTNGEQGKPHAAVFAFDKPIDLNGTLELKLEFERHYACPLGHFRIAVCTEAKPAEARGHVADIEELLAKPAAQRTPEEKEILMQRFFESAPETAAAREEIKKLRNSIPKLNSVLCMRERPANNPRATYLHHRGEWMQPKEKVEPGVPSFLPQLPADAPKNRLSYAKWLVSKENPLTARVIVNRQWQAFFGRGIVRTLEDFGYQGEMPSHPELLDWLAIEFMNQGWSLKKLHTLIVTSATYRQSSSISPELAQRDSANILLARGPRFRFEAELVRDSVLKAAGLLSAKMGGPGVFPPQPASVTTEGAYGALAWNASQGEDRYRRSLYTFVKRSAPFAMISTFDGPTGEVCLAKREVSNSALQALTLLNDTLFMEAAQAMGKQIAADKTLASDEDKSVRIFRRSLIRIPQPDEIASLAAFAKKQRERFAAKQIDPDQFAGRGEGNAVERAVWTAVARAVMNLDEMIVKR
jgi:hypothetical protein